MANLNIAIMVHNLRMGVYEGLEEAARMGVPGVHLSAGVKGFRPQDLDLAGRKKLLRHLDTLHLEISAISAWGGKVDLGELEGIDGHIEDGKRYLELAADLECGIWQGHCGIMPHDSEDPRWQRFVEAFGKLCEHGEKVGACIAIETGPEPPAVLRQMIVDVGSDALRVNYDPANLILWPARYMNDTAEGYNREKAFAEYEPVEGVTTLEGMIVHTHAKDAMVQENGGRKEVPLGSGWIDWNRYVTLLRQQGYTGYFAIEREVGDDPVKDIRNAVDFLRTLG